MNMSGEHGIIESIEWMFESIWEFVVEGWEWIELALGTSAFMCGIVVGLGIVLLPQLVVVYAIHVVPSIRRLTPWVQRKPIKIVRTPWEEWQSEYTYNPDTEEPAIWLNAIFSTIWILQNETIFRKGFQQFIAGEVDDLYKEPFGCLIDDLSVPKTTIGSCFPTFTNFVRLNDPTDNGPYRVTADFSLTGSFSFTVNLFLRTLGLPVSLWLHIAEITGKLLLEFNTFPEPTLSISLYPNVILDLNAEVRVCGQRWEKLNKLVSYGAAKFIISKFVLPNLKSFYLLNKAELLKAGYVQMVRGNKSSKNIPSFAHCWLEVKENAMSIYEDHTQDFPICTFSPYDIISLDYNDGRPNLDDSPEANERLNKGCTPPGKTAPKNNKATMYIELAAFGLYELRCDHDEHEQVEGIKAGLGFETELEQWHTAMLTMEKNTNRDHNVDHDLFSIDTENSVGDRPKSGDMWGRAASSVANTTSIVEHRFHKLLRKYSTVLSSSEAIVTQERINHIQKSIKLQQRRLEDVEKLQVEGKVDIMLELEIEMQKEHVRALHTILQRASTILIKGTSYLNDATDETQSMCIVQSPSVNVGDATSVSMKSSRSANAGYTTGGATSSETNGGTTSLFLTHNIPDELAKFRNSNVSSPKSFPSLTVSPSTKRSCSLVRGSPSIISKN